MRGIVGSYFNTRGSGVVAKLGTDGQVFTSTGAGLSQGFEAAPGGGKIGQVVQTVNTATETLSSDTFTTIADFTVAITPVATSSKILVMVNAQFGGGNGYSRRFQLFRDTTQIFMGDGAIRSAFGFNTNGTRQGDTGAICYLDSPSSTSEVSYSLKWSSQESNTQYMGRSQSNDAEDAETASSITAMEVLA